MFIYAEKLCSRYLTKCGTRQNICNTDRLLILLGAYYLILGRSLTVRQVISRWKCPKTGQTLGPTIVLEMETLSCFFNCHTLLATITWMTLFHQYSCVLSLKLKLAFTSLLNICFQITTFNTKLLYRRPLVPAALVKIRFNLISCRGTGSDYMCTFMLYLITCNRLLRV